MAGFRLSVAFLLSMSTALPALSQTPPTVTVNFPNGGEVFPATTNQGVVWTATDDGAVSSIDIFYRDAPGADWKALARDLSNTGVFYWYVHNTPTTMAVIRVVATDDEGLESEDISNAPFTITQQPGGIVPTTLRDFEMPGTQPLDHDELVQNAACYGCHLGVDSEHGPGSTYFGSMMHNSIRDPLFHACLAIAEQDAPSSGDLCIRCHAPSAWLAGRSTPTDGSQLTDIDRNGVSCNFCHRMVDPNSDPENPSVDAGILAAVTDLPEIGFGNATFVTDPLDRRRGPYSDVTPPHDWLYSPHHRESDMCASCHNVSNPVYERVSGYDYTAGPLDTPIEDLSPSNALPIERTFSEWQNSDFVAGIYAPEFAGTKPDGIVSSCQDCHMPDANARGCSFGDERDDLGSHEFVGGNAWVPNLISQLYPDEVQSYYTNLVTERAIGMLQKASVLDVAVNPDGAVFNADVTVTNRTGHKLPTGYPEGRRMWLNVKAFDGADQLVYESGAYDVATGVLTKDDDVAVFEAKMGVSTELAAVTSLAAGTSFHFVLNDTLYKDNRIPPVGFTNAAFDDFGGMPVEDGVAAPRYPDGQNWDQRGYELPGNTTKVITTLYYQTTSKEYIEFLRDENTTNTAGQDLYDLWVNNGRAAPVAMEADTTFIGTVGVPDVTAASPTFRSAPIQNPFEKALTVRVDLGAPADVELSVFDVQGRQLTRFTTGVLGGGAHRVAWDGRNQAGLDVGAGVFFVRVRVNEIEQAHRVVRL